MDAATYYVKIYEEKMHTSQYNHAPNILIENAKGDIMMQSNNPQTVADWLKKKGIALEEISQEYRNNNTGPTHAHLRKIRASEWKKVAQSYMKL